MAQTNQNLLTLQSDLASQIDREKLADYVVKHLPSINVLINNGGIQRRVALSEDDASWHEKQIEIDILFAGPVHLNSLLLPHMLKSDSPKMIINVTSGGAYIPQTFAPIYSACKAALHSYTMNLRHSLRNTSVSVTELIPPAVATSLSGNEQAHGADPDLYCDAVFARIAHESASDIGYGPTETQEFKDAALAYGKLFIDRAERIVVASYTHANQ
jgi:uncharacterized oxidoreductase